MHGYASRKLIKHSPNRHTHTKKQKGTKPQSAHPTQGLRILLRYLPQTPDVSFPHLLSCWQFASCFPPGSCIQQWVHHRGTTQRRCLTTDKTLWMKQQFWKMRQHLAFCDVIRYLPSPPFISLLIDSVKILTLLHSIKERGWHPFIGFVAVLMLTELFFTKIRT